MISITCKVLCSVVDALVHSHETIFSSGVLTALQVRAHIWQHSSDTLLVFGHMSANFRTYFKNKSVLETLQSARSIRTTLSAVVNAHHVNNSHQSSTRCEVKSIFDHSRPFLLLCFAPYFKFEFQKGYIFECQFLFYYYKSKFSHSLLHPVIRKAVNRNGPKVVLCV
jgi:hypothetical protein